MGNIDGRRHRTSVDEAMECRRDAVRHRRPGHVEKEEATPTQSPRQGRKAASAGHEMIGSGDARKCRSIREWQMEVRCDDPRRQMCVPEVACASLQMSVRAQVVVAW
jgi:hypothetical protein